MSRTFLLARVLTILVLLLGALAAPLSAEAATYTVNTTDDATDGRCDARHCSLREAVQEAHYSPGADTVAFNLPGTPPYVIRLLSGLTIIASDLTVAGDTQPGYVDRPVVILDGSRSTGSAFLIVGDRATIRGLALVNFSMTAIRTGDETLVERNYIGSNPDGTAAGNGIGVKVQGTAPVVRDNVISANETGILLDYSADAVVQRNRIGTTPDGETALGNGTGIRLQGSARDTLIGGAGIWDFDGNVIAGSSLYGIDDASSPYGGHVIANNRIGTNASGNRAIPNAVGINRWAEHDSYEGSLTIQYNVVSGNGIGMRLNGNGHSVYLNFVGIDRLGARTVPNTEVGIQLEGCGVCRVEQNVISGNPTGILLIPGSGIEFDAVIAGNRIGTDPGERVLFPNGIGIDIEGGQRTVVEHNTIGGNDVGLRLGAGDATVRHNFIGVHATGSPPALPNGTGIQVGLGVEPSTIGASSEADGNLIAFNTGDGILSSGGGGFAVQANKIYQNGGHGVHIDAGRGEPPPEGLGVTLGTNSIYDNGGLGIRVEHPALVGDLQPPELTSTRGHSVSGTALPGALIEVFLAAPDPSHSGEGKTYVGFGYAAGDGEFTITVTGEGTCPTYTATVTDSHGNTSEFSRNRATCLSPRPLVAVIWILVVAGGGSAFTVIIRRRPLTLRTVPWLVIGGLLGAGLGILLLRLPFVQVEWGQPDTQRAPAPAPGNLPVTLTPLLDITVTPGTPVPGPEAMAREDANCRQGPSTQFNVATHLTQGQIVPITGRLAQGGWWQVRPADLQIPCWIAERVVEPYGDLNLVPVVIPPLLPTPTPTQEPVSPAQGCLCWNGNVYICTVPCPGYCKGGPCTP